MQKFFSCDIMHGKILRNDEMFACLSGLSVAIMLSNFCLMYFAFRNSITLAEKKNLAVGYCAWATKLFIKI